LDDRLRKELSYRAQSDPLIHPAIKADLLKRLALLPLNPPKK
jgi:hypothetical protein